MAKLRTAKNESEGVRKCIKTQLSSTTRHRQLLQLKSFSYVELLLMFYKIILEWAPNHKMWTISSYKIILEWAQNHKMWKMLSYKIILKWAKNLKILKNS